MCSPHYLTLDQHRGAQGGLGDPEQFSETSSNTSTIYALRNTRSRQLGQQIPFYKYLNSGAKPEQVKRSEDSADTDDRIQNFQSTERVFGSQDLTVTNSLSESSTSQPDTLPLNSPDKVLSVPVPLFSTDPASYTGLLRFPEGPPSRSPLPPGWSYSEPSSDSNLSQTFLQCHLS